MIDGLKPYAEYKDSGVPWLGVIPANWNLRRMKLLLREVDSRSSSGKEQLLRVSQYTGVTQRKARNVRMNQILEPPRSKAISALPCMT